MVRTSILSVARLAAPLLCLAFAASPLACGASAKDTEDRMLERMNREIDEAQSDTFKLTENGDEPGVDAGSPRAGAAGEAKQVEPPAAPPPPARATPTPTPHLPVVRLAPDGTEETGGQGEQAPRLRLTNASLGRPPAPHPPSRVSAAAADAKLARDAAPAQRTYPESGDAPAAPKPAPPQPSSPDAHPPTNDEDNEHIEPVDEDNEHLVGGDTR
jgi:hypothetical protein